MTTLNYAQIRYNMIQQKASHNSYQRTEGLVDQMLYWRLRAVEMDIHTSNDDDGWPDLVDPVDWYVYHKSSGSNSNITRLSDGLRLLAGFRAAVPDHEVVTVFVDIKDPFDAQVHTPEAFDQLLVDTLGREAIVAPSDLLGDHSNLQTAITQDGWPLLSSLRGKFMFALTTGSIDDPGANIYSYASTNSEANQRLAFLAPNLLIAEHIDSKSFVIFFNLDQVRAGLGQPVFDAGFISRAYHPDSERAWEDVVGERVHVIATDEVNSQTSPWARTDNAQGWPFQGNGVSLDPNITEPGVLFGVEANGGGIDETRDGLFFVHDELADGSASVEQVFVGAPDSNEDISVVGGLMARASLADDAAFVAVLRTGLDGASFTSQIEGVQVVYRPAKGQPAVTILPQFEAGSVPASLQSNVNRMLGSDALWLALELDDERKQASARFSIDGSTWHEIATVELSEPLLTRGWAVAGVAKYLFGNASGEAPSQTAAIGGVAGQLFVGVYPPDNADDAAVAS